jgi:hypothetical protein
MQRRVRRNHHEVAQDGHPAATYPDLGEVQQP